jgi:hypothetical protein
MINIILGYMSSSPSFPTSSSKPPPRTPTKPPYKSHKAFLHDLLQAFGDSDDEAQKDAVDNVATSADLEPGFINYCCQQYLLIKEKALNFWML